MEPGDYAIRGGIIDIVPPGDGGPVRLDFFGDVLEGARRFEVESQRTVEKIARVELAPATEAPSACRQTRTPCRCLWCC